MDIISLTLLLLRRNHSYFVCAEDWLFALLAHIMNCTCDSSACVAGTEAVISQASSTHYCRYFLSLA